MGAEKRLVACLAPILHDLAAAGLPPPEIWHERWPLGPGAPTATVHAADGSAWNIRLPPEIAFPDQVAMLADQIQEWVAASRAAGEQVFWPACPEHPGSHSLRTDVALGCASTPGIGLDTAAGRAVWRCPLSGRIVCAIGNLPSAKAR